MAVIKLTDLFDAHFLNFIMDSNLHYFLLLDFQGKTFLKTIYRR